MHTAQMYTPPVRQTWRQRLASALPALSRGARKAGALPPMAAAFFLLSIAQCFSVPSPYLLCCMMALAASGLRPLGAFLGMGIGLGFRMLWGIALDPWQFAAAAMAYPLLKLRGLSRGGRRTLALTLLMARTIPGLLDAADWQTVLLAVAGVLLGMASLPALERAAQLIRNPRREWNTDDLLCLLLPGLLLLAGAARLSLFGLNMGYAAACALVLLLAWIAGGVAGVCGGMACGLALMVGGQSALMLITLTFGALAAGLLQGKLRLLTAGVFLLAMITAMYLAALSFRLPLFFAALAGSLGIVLLPPKAARGASRLVRRVCWTRPRENAYTRLRMQKWVKAINCLADALPHPQIPQPSVTDESEALTESLCADCDRLPICWRDQYAATKAGMEALAGRQDEGDGYYDVINRYFSACPRISRLPGLLSDLDLARQKKNQQAIYADYQRDMLKTHLTALSQAAQRISQEGLEWREEEQEWLTQTEEALQSMRFPGQAAFAKKVDGRMMLCLQCEPLSLRPVVHETLARNLGNRLGVCLQITQQQHGRIVLEEEPPLRAVTGMATVCAVTPERKRKVGQPLDNGDAVLVRPLSGGKLLLALSDGMGHGAGAQDASSKTLEMLSLCMEAGYTRSQAMTAVNGAMLSATGGEKFATVDLCLIDLWTGDAAMNKLGACASLLMQGQKLQMIEGAALPLGIIEHVVPMEHTFSLAEGDLLLMISDGVHDAFAAEEQILAVLRRCLDDTPQHIADALLQEALIQQDGLPADDMTVLCAQICPRRPQTKHREMY